MTLPKVACAALLAAASLAGCAGMMDVSRPRLGSQEDFGLVPVGAGLSYLIDPRTEACLLVDAYHGAMAAVSCAKLKRSVPEAAKYITWDATAEVACPAPPEGPVQRPTPEVMKPVNWEGAAPKR